MHNLPTLGESKSTIQTTADSSVCHSAKTSFAQQDNQCIWMGSVGGPMEIILKVRRSQTKMRRLVALLCLILNEI